MRFTEIILQDIDRYRPDGVVLIDYPGFNLYFSSYLVSRGIPCLYYVTPQLWAWNPGRVRKIKNRIQQMLVIFPFEVDFYRKAGIAVEYVGHPLLDRLALFQPDPAFPSQLGIASQEKILTLLPGSRETVVRANLPIMLRVAGLLARQVPTIRPVIAIHPKHRQLANHLIERERGAVSPQLVFGQTYDAIYWSHLALVTSGTATLETAMIGTPLVVIYHIPHLYHWVVKHTSFLQCPYIALPNIVANSRIVPEFLISNAQDTQIAGESLALWQDGERRQTCQRALADLQHKLERPGASRKAAETVWRFLTRSG